MEIVLQGITYKLWPAKPDWSVSPRLTLTAPSVLVESETGLATAQMRGAIRVRWDAQYWVDAEALAELEAITLDPAHAWVALPLWDMPGVIGAHYWGIGEPINSIVASATRPDDATAVPIVLGRFDKVELQASTDELGMYKMQFVEDCPLSAGVDIHTSDADEWPAQLYPEWSTPVRMLYHSPLELTTYADQRHSQIEGEYAPPRLGQSAGFRLSGAQIEDLIAFWAAKHGEVGSFTAARWFAPGGSGEMLPMRFGSDSLALTFETDQQASATINLIEAQGSDVVTDATAHLYEFTYQVKPAQTYRFTDWEGDIVIGETTWESRPMQIESIEDGLLTESHGLSLSCHAGDWNPLMKFIPFRLEGRMQLAVYAINVNSGEGELKWSGDVEQVQQADGEQISVKCGSQYGLLDRPAPRLMLSPKCNHRFGDSGCGVNRAAYAETATINNAAGATLSVSGLSRAGGYYTGGLLEAGSGATYERRTVTAHSGSMISIGKRLLYSGVGDAVTVSPGCDRSWDGCQKYENRTRFSGFPQMPEENPTMEAVQDDGTRGKK